MWKIDQTPESFVIEHPFESFKETVAQRVVEVCNDATKNESAHCFMKIQGEESFKTKGTVNTSCCNGK
jgi:hypothetical protein